MESSKKLKPGKWLYAIGALVIAFGVIASLAIAISYAAGSLANAKTVQVPGTAQLSLDKTGTYTMVYDYDPSNGSSAPITDFSKYSGLKFTLTQEQGGNDISVTSMSSNALQFSVTQTGTYKLSAAYASGTTPAAVMMVIAPVTVPTALIAIIFIIGVVGGISIIIVTSKKRKANKRLQASN